MCYYRTPKQRDTEAATTGQWTPRRSFEPRPPRGVFGFRSAVGKTSRGNTVMRGSTVMARGSTVMARGKGPPYCEVKRNRLNLGDLVIKILSSGVT